MSAVREAPTQGLQGVWAQMMERNGVRPADRPALAKQLSRLRKEYPGETPAGLFHRARKRGAPIPPPRCIHHVWRGDCVVCDPLVGQRLYFTSGGTHIHSTPACRSLSIGQEKVRRRGGVQSPIEVVRVYAGVTDRRDPCKTCFSGRVGHSQPTLPGSALSRRSQAKPARAKRGKQARLVTITRGSPPATGTPITWLGYEGVVVGTCERGLQIAVDGARTTISWGDRASLGPLR